MRMALFMLRAAAVLVCGVVSTTGCVSYRGSHTSAKLGGIATLAGLAIATVGLVVKGGQTDSARLDEFLIGGAVAATGAVLGVGGLIGMSVFEKEDPPRSAAPEQPADPALTDDECVRLRAMRLREANRHVDRDARARALQGIPRCPDRSEPAAITPR